MTELVVILVPCLVSLLVNVLALLFIFRCCDKKDTLEVLHKCTDYTNANYKTRNDVALNRQVKKLSVRLEKEKQQRGLVNETIKGKEVDLSQERQEVGRLRDELEEKRKEKAITDKKLKDTEEKLRRAEEQLAKAEAEKQQGEHDESDKTVVCYSQTNVEVIHVKAQRRTTLAEVDGAKRLECKNEKKSSQAERGSAMDDSQQLKRNEDQDSQDRKLRLREQMVYEREMRVKKEAVRVKMLQQKAEKERKMVMDSSMRLGEESYQMSQERIHMERRLLGAEQKLQEFANERRSRIKLLEEKDQTIAEQLAKLTHAETMIDQQKGVIHDLEKSAMDMFRARLARENEMEETEQQREMDSRSTRVTGRVDWRGSLRRTLRRCAVCR